MAIVLDTVVAIRRGGDKITLCNVDAENYPEQTFSIDPNQKVDVEHHTWGNYFLCAYKGVYEHLSSSEETASPPPPMGLQVMVYGRVPTGGGLSSSAAIVCASALALLGVHGIRLRKGEVAEFAAKAERYVGVTSGGMDQAISIMGRLGTAQHIEFNPVRAKDVTLPSEAIFVIANSLAVSNKAEGAEGRYNLRVVECRLASAVLALLLGETNSDAVGYQTLKEVEPLAREAYPSPDGTHNNAGFAAVCKLLHDEPYDTAEIEGLLGCKLSSLFQNDSSALRVLSKFSTFKLRQRAEHVYAEQLRVIEFAAVCGNDSMSAEDKLRALALLMDESQASCRDLYECSCPELDSLISIAKDSGALGSRLTGAGWGGCAVSLIHTDDVDAFVSKVVESYYVPLIESGKLKESEISSTIFASKPSGGGGLLQFQI